MTCMSARSNREDDESTIHPEPKVFASGSLSDTV